MPPRPEFQAVILAAVADGDTLAPLTNSLPLGLLPVANRPLLSYQLELLTRSHSFKQVLVLTVERWLSQLATWVSESYKGPLQVELLVVPDRAGSADALRHVRAHIVTDFVLIAGDVITDVPFQRMADLHRLQGAAMTALYRESAPREAGVAKKAKDLDGIDFVGVDERGQRLLSVEAAADCEGGVVSVSQSLLRAYPHVTLRTDLIDAHVYIFAPWVLDVLELKEHFVSAKFELVPYLVRKQFLSKANLSKAKLAAARRASGAADGAVDSVASGGGSAPTATGSGPPTVTRAPSDVACTKGGGAGSGAVGGGGAVGSASAFAMAAGEATRRQLDHDDFRCCCYIMPHDAAVYCLRVSSLKEYVQANLDVSRESRVTHYEKAEASEGTVVKEGNFVHKSRDRDSTLGEAVEVAGRTAIKKSSIGPHCRIGMNVKITNCVLMDHVVIGDKVSMSNSVVCSNSEVREGASLKDVQVAAGVTVEAGANHKGESITEEMDTEED
jgi:translation initiation factor eIF-2B subunit gamma